MNTRSEEDQAPDGAVQLSRGQRQLFVSTAVLNVFIYVGWALWQGLPNIFRIPILGSPEPEPSSTLESLMRLDFFVMYLVLVRLLPMAVIGTLLVRDGARGYARGGAFFALMLGGLWLLPQEFYLTYRAWSGCFIYEACLGKSGRTLVMTETGAGHVDGSTQLATSNTAIPVPFPGRRAVPKKGTNSLIPLREQLALVV